MNVIIIHGSSPEDKLGKDKFILKHKEHWFPWSKKKLEEKGIRCDVPLMPESWNPKYFEWKKEFEKYPVEEDSILVGTSTGAAFLVRWLGETKKKIKRLILVAPVTGKEKCNAWLNKDYENFDVDESIKNRVKEIIIFYSDNDHPERFESAKTYANKLDAKLIFLKGRGHFIKKHMRTKEFPELLEEILK